MNEGLVIYRVVEFVGFLTSIIVCGLATQAFRETRKRGLLLLAIAGGLGAGISVLPELQGFRPSWGAWTLEMLLRVIDGALWLCGTWLVIRDYVSLLLTTAQRGTSPNVGPTDVHESSMSGGGPPSVS
jgi:hypothetical protein